MDSLQCSISLREVVLKTINDNRFYNERALEIANSKDKVYVVFDTHNKKLVDVGTTRKFAEYIVENDKEQYVHWIDWNRSETIKIVKPLEMFVFNRCEIKGHIAIEAV